MIAAQAMKEATTRVEAGKSDDALKIVKWRTQNIRAKHSKRDPRKNGNDSKPPPFNGSTDCMSAVGANYDLVNE